MKTKVQKVSACRVKLAVEATAEEIDPIYKKIHAAFKAQVRLPGFRPGKAPWARIETLYGKEIQDKVNQEVLSKLASASAEEKLHVARVVDVEQLNSAMGQGASGTLVLDLEPEFKLPDVSKWQVKKVNVEVTDAEVTERIDSARRMMASYRDAKEDEVASAADLMSISFTSDLDAEAMTGAAKHFVSSEDYWVQLQEDFFIPGLAAALIGKKLGETCAFDATFPGDFKVAELAGKTVHYQVTVKTMRKQEPLDDEALLKRMGNYENMDAFRASVRENITSYKQAEEKRRVLDDVAAAIAKSVSFDVPERVLDEKIYDELAVDPSKPLEQFKGDGEALRKSEAYKQATERAKDALRRGYVLQQVAKDRSIKLTQEDMQGAIQSLAASTKLSEKEVLKRLQNNNRLDDFMLSTLERKTLDVLADECATL